MILKTILSISISVSIISIASTSWAAPVSGLSNQLRLELEKIENALAQARESEQPSHPLVTSVPPTLDLNLFFLDIVPYVTIGVPAIGVSIKPEFQFAWEKQEP